MFNLRHQYSLQNSGRDLCFDPLSMPDSAARWQPLFDLLATNNLGNGGKLGATSSCHLAFQGRLNSYSLFGHVTLPDGWVTFNYNALQPQCAVLKLNGYRDFNCDSIHSAINCTIDQQWLDPDWMFLRYLAQREARAKLGVCQLCGQNMGRGERHKGQWRHDRCQIYLP